MKERKQLQALLRNNLYFFLQRVFREVVPGGRFVPGWYLEAIAYELELVASGESNRLIVTLPPRHLKSIAVSIAFTAWRLGHDPTHRIVCVSYSQHLADYFSLLTRRVMQSEWYQQMFPATRLDPRKCSARELATTAGGYRLATSVGGTLTGRGGQLIVIDDPHNASEVLSEVTRQGTLDWFHNTLISRLDNPDDCIILVQQRLHEEDLAGHLLETDDWYHLNLPAIAEQEEEIEIGPDRYHRRRPGDLLHPERMPLEALEARKRELGSYGFEAQYQQRPAPLGGGIVKWEWFRFYDRPPVQRPGDMIVQSWDPAQSVAGNSDWSVCTTSLVRDNHFYVLEVQRFRAEAPELINRIVQSARQWHANLVIMEAVGHGLGLYQQVCRKAGCRVMRHEPKGDKVARMVAESPAIEAGYVHLPREADWLLELQREIVNFPNGRHDDQVDSLSQLLYWARMRGPNRPKMECRLTIIGGEPDLDAHLADLW